MSRLPRRPSRVKPPLRGRAATKAYYGTFAPVQSRRHLIKSPSSGAYRRDIYLPAPPYSGVEPSVPMPTPDMPSPRPTPPLPESDLANLYKHWGRLLRGLDEPWKWLLLTVILLSGLFLLGRLL
ncbi:MAG: hypothetical protein AAF959_00745 [Cyanobacteria bacterium P01_D01_bin.56]